MKMWKYRHYKWKDYEVLYVATHSEDLSEYVVYKQLYWEQGIWIRPKKMFEESIILDWKQTKRFTYIWDK